MRKERMTYLCSTICGEDGGNNEQERNGEKVSPTKRPSLALLLGALPTAASLGLPESITKMEKENDVEAENGELDLSSIDEDEIDRYILNEKEIKVKTELWMLQNADYLKEKKEKEERIAKEKEEGTCKEQKPKKNARRREPINASTADEAIEKMLEQKHISTKINYDVLKNLKKSSLKSPTRQTEEASTRAKRTPAACQRKPQLTSPKIGKTISSFGKRPFHVRHSHLESQKSPSHTITHLKGIGAPVATPAAPTQNTAVVERGPVAYEDTVEEEEEEDEEDEHCVSAMQLMGGTDNGYEVDDDDGF